MPGLHQPKRAGGVNIDAKWLQGAVRCRRHLAGPPDQASPSDEELLEPKPDTPAMGSTAGLVDNRLCERVRFTHLENAATSAPAGPRLAVATPATGRSVRCSTPGYEVAVVSV